MEHHDTLDQVAQTTDCDSRISPIIEDEEEDADAVSEYRCDVCKIPFITKQLLGEHVFSAHILVKSQITDAPPKKKRLRKKR